LGIYGIYRDGEGRKLVLIRERIVRERMIRAGKQVPAGLRQRLQGRHIAAR